MFCVQLLGHWGLRVWGSTSEGLGVEGLELRGFGFGGLFAA